MNIIANSNVPKETQPWRREMQLEVEKLRRDLDLVRGNVDNNFAQQASGFQLVGRQIADLAAVDAGLAATDAALAATDASLAAVVAAQVASASSSNVSATITINSSVSKLIETTVVGPSWATQAVVTTNVFFYTNAGTVVAGEIVLNGEAHTIGSSPPGPGYCIVMETSGLSTVSRSYSRLVTGIANGTVTTAFYGASDSGSDTSAVGFISASVLFLR